MSDSPSRPVIRFHVGGPDFHPVEEQAQEIVRWLGPEFTCSFHHDKEVFEFLPETDLLVVMGLSHSAREDYEPLSPSQESAFSSYIGAGRPLLLHHGAAASYDDSDIFKRLIGINWVWGGECPTQHSPIGDYKVTVTRVDHPLMAHVGDYYTLHDELYYNLFTQPGITPEVLAEAEFEGRRLPMVQCFQGGRQPGAGKGVYLANGHDMRAFECPALRQLWLNSVQWLLS